MLIACYYILSRYEGADMEAFRKAIQKISETVFMTPGSGSRKVSEIIS